MSRVDAAPLAVLISLSLFSTPMLVFAQGQPPPGAGGSPAPAQQPAPGAATTPGQETPVAVAALPTPDPDALARYVPAGKLAILFEFPGLDAYDEAWKGTAASTILAETKTGAMFNEIVMQLHAQIVAATGPSKVTSAEEVAMLRHLIRRGLIFAVSGDKANPSASGAVVVLRDAFTEGAKEMFARQVLGQMQPDAKPEILDKPGGRRVAVMPLASNGQEVAWWVEDRRDIVIVAPSTHVDAVLDTLGGRTSDVTTAVRRKALAAAEGDRRPLAWGYIDFSAAAPWPEQAVRLGFDNVQAIQFRWGAEGKALRTELDVEAPAPRKGVLQMLEQPPFTVAALPPIPEGVESVSVLSIDPNETMTRLTDVMTQLGVANAMDAFEDVEKAFQQSTRLELRRDVLAHLGPKVVTYTFPQKKDGLAALNALNPLAGFQLPRMAVLVDVKDVKAINKSITQLMSFANKQLAMLDPAAAQAGGDATPGQLGDEAAAGGRGGRGARGGSGGTAAKPKAAGFEFKMTSAKPLTYQLSLPPQFAAILNAKPTIALGAKHLVIATGPDLAAAAVKDEAESDATWTPGPEFAQALDGLPGDLIYLQVNDPRESLPRAIAELPMAINKAAAALVNRSAAMMNGGVAPAQMSVVQLVVPAEMMPSSADVRPHLFPGAAVMSVDAAGFHVVMRDAFFDITSISAVLNGLAQAPPGSLGPLPFGQPPGAGSGESPGSPPPPAAPVAEPAAGGPRGRGTSGAGGSRATVPN